MATVEQTLAAELERAVAKHLLGKHNQKDHGRRRGVAPSTFRRQFGKQERARAVAEIEGKNLEESRKNAINYLYARRKHGIEYAIMLKPDGKVQNIRMGGKSGVLPRSPRELLNVGSAVDRTAVHNHPQARWERGGYPMSQPDMMNAAATGLRETVVVSARPTQRGGGNVYSLKFDNHPTSREGRKSRRAVARAGIQLLAEQGALEALLPKGQMRSILNQGKRKDPVSNWVRNNTAPDWLGPARHLATLSYLDRRQVSRLNKISGVAFSKTPIEKVVASPPPIAPRVQPRWRNRTPPVAKHLKGKHDQKLHGRRGRLPTPLQGNRIARSEARKIVAEVQGSSREETIANAERWLQKRNAAGDLIEFGFVINDQGRVRSVAMGDEGSVATNIRTLGGSAYVHNHPLQDNAVLSFGDLRLASWGTSSMIAVADRTTARLDIDWPKKGREAVQRENDLDKVMAEARTKQHQRAKAELGEAGYKALNRRPDTLGAEWALKDAPNLQKDWMRGLNAVPGFSYTSTPNRRPARTPVAASVSTELASSLTKHLRGRHNQKDHGNRFLQTQFGKPEAAAVRAEIEGPNLAASRANAIRWLDDRRTDRIEYGIALDDDGKVTRLRMGGKTAVAFYTGIKDKTIVHNHPGGTFRSGEGDVTLSSPDFVMSSSRRVREMVAVSPRSVSSVTYNWTGNPIKDRTKTAQVHAAVQRSDREALRRIGIVNQVIPSRFYEAYLERDPVRRRLLDENLNAIDGVTFTSQPISTYRGAASPARTPVAAAAAIAVAVAKHNPGGHSHDQSKHGKRGRWGQVTNLGADVIPVYDHTHFDNLSEREKQIVNEIWGGRHGSDRIVAAPETIVRTPRGMKVVGNFLDPGNPDPTDPRARLGAFVRRVERQPRPIRSTSPFSAPPSRKETVATHEQLSLKMDVQGQGVGRSFYRRSEDGYRRYDIDAVELSAGLRVGGYAWAREGFDWKPDWDGKKRVSDSVLESMITESGNGGALRPPSGLWRPSDQRKLVGVLDAHNQGRRPPTPSNIAELGRDGPLNHDGYHLGKAVLMGSNWEGRKELRRKR